MAASGAWFGAIVETVCAALHAPWRGEWGGAVRAFGRAEDGGDV